MKKYFRNDVLLDGQIVLYPNGSTDHPIVRAFSEEEYDMKLAVAGISEDEVDKCSTDECLWRSMCLNSRLIPSIFIQPAKMSAPVGYKEAVGK